jgi:hypothetical protein
MTGHDAPEFDDFESTDEQNQDGAVWPDSDLPPETDMDSTPWIDHDQVGPGDCLESGEDPVIDDIEGPIRVEGGASNAFHASEHAALNGKGSNGQNGPRPPARHPQPRVDTAPPVWRQRQSVPLDTATMSNPRAGSGQLSAEYALMEALADWAVKVKRRSEAGRLVAAMVPLALQSVSRYRRDLQPVIPVLIRGAASVAELMHAERARPLIALMPAILNQTVYRLAHLAAQGHVVNIQLATDVLSEYTAAVIERGSRVDRRKQSNRPAAQDGSDEYEYDGF